MTTLFDHTENIISPTDFILVERFDLEDPGIDDQLERYLRDLNELPENELEMAVIEDIEG